MLVYVGLQWIGCVQVCVQLTKNCPTNKTLRPLLLQLFLVRSVFFCCTKCLLKIRHSGQSVELELLVMHMNSKSTHGFHHQKRATDMCAPFVPVGNLSVTWSSFRGDWIYLSLGLQASGHTWWALFELWQVQKVLTWIPPFILFLWVHS